MAEKDVHELLGKLFTVEPARQRANKPLTEQRKPATEGIWYWVYYAPNWKLEAFITSDPDDEALYQLGHPVAWSTYIVPLLKDHYKLEDVVARKLEELPYGMPRGRMGKEGGIWKFWYGDDFPHGLSPERAKRQIISVFWLNAPAASGKVEWHVAPHEKMNVDDQIDVQSIIGVKIPL